MIPEVEKKNVRDSLLRRDIGNNDQRDEEMKQEFKQTHYLEIPTRSLFYRHFVYLDREHCSFSLLFRHKVRPRFRDAIRTVDKDYMLIVCKVRKKEAKDFIAAMEELPNKMCLCGYLNYEECCERTFGKILSCIGRQQDQAA